MSNDPSILRVLATAWILSIALAPDCLAKPRPAARPSPEPIVVGFTGWVPPTTSYRGSAVEQIVDRLRSRGVSAEVHPPGDWPGVAERLVARGKPESPIVLLGYSMGAAAAIHVAQKLGSVGVPVSRIVIVEAWNPEPVPGNVGEATHFYSTRLASHLTPGPGNTGVIENIDLRGRVAGIEDASHISMSQMAAVQDLVIDAIGGRTARAVTGPGKAPARRIEASAGSSP